MGGTDEYERKQSHGVLALSVSKKRLRTYCPQKRQRSFFMGGKTEMIENWNQVQITPEFCDQGVDCYRLKGDFLNEYYIISEAETRKLMNHP